MKTRVVAHALLRASETSVSTRVLTRHAWARALPGKVGTIVIAADFRVDECRPLAFRKRVWSCCQRSSVRLAKAILGPPRQRPIAAVAFSRAPVVCEVPA